MRGTKRKYINDILQDNHLEHGSMKVNKSTKVNENKRESMTTSWEINQHSSVLQRRMNSKKTGKFD